MPITINTIDGFAVLAKLMKPNKIEAMKAAKILVEITPSKVTFKRGPEVLSSLMCKPQTLQAILDGQDPLPGVKIALVHAAEVAYAGVTNDTALKEEGVPKPSTMEMLLGASKPAMAPPPPEASKVVVTATSPIFPAADMQKAATVKLEVATQLYQPVRGTGSGSRYFVVAIRDDLKIAARYINDKLSVRAEGPGLEKYGPMLDAAGFHAGGQGGLYRSIHLGPLGGEHMAGRTLGSVIGALDIEFASVAPKIGVIANKGSD